MNYRLLSIFIFVSLSAIVHAQTVSISGKVVDADNNEPAVGTTVQMYQSDSVYVGGAVADTLGLFRIAGLNSGMYRMKISSLSYADTTFVIDTKQLSDVSLGTIRMARDAIMLDETVVTALLPKMVVRDDTIVYNADAYQVPEGSAIEALVEQLPGAKIDDSGKITVNGKEVKKVMLDGKEFMGGGSTNEMMKNLPSYIVDKIKSYDEKSDMSKLTGIDDGNEMAVLDFTVKPRMRNGINSNLDVGYGTEDRYGVNASVSRFSGNLRFNVVGGANNVNGRGFSGRRGGRGGGNGQSTTKNTGVNVNYDNRKGLKIDGGVRWNHNNNDTREKTSTENFVSRNAAFSNRNSQSLSRSDSWNANFRIEWKPDTMTTINMRPTASYSTNDRRSENTSASYLENPYDFVENPLDNQSIDDLAARGVMVNRRMGKSISSGETKSFGTSFMIHRRLNSKGRNINLNTSINFSNSENKSLSASSVHLYQVKDVYGNDSTYQTNRYTLRPSNSFNYSLQLTYTEPILKNVFLQTSYRFRYSHSKSDPSTYDFDDMTEDVFLSSLNRYRDWDSYFNTLTEPLEYYLDRNLSRYAEHTNTNHDIDAQLRIVRTKLNLNVGFALRPQRSHMQQDYMGRHIDTIRTVTNWAPSLNMTYRFTKTSNLRLRWNGSTGQPSLDDLIDIRDDSDPLNIRRGNPGLKPSFTNSISANYNNTWRKHRLTTIATHMNFRTVSNSISSAVTYNEQTGGSVRRPENINGNWNLSTGFTFNTSIDTLAAWNVNSSTDYSFGHHVGYITLDNQSNSVENVTRNHEVSEQLGLSYRSKLLSVDLDGSFTYNHARNELRPQSNLDTWRFSYGGSVTLNLPWNMSISTNIHEHSRRGYANEEMNTNELLWNAQISQGFLRRKALTISLQFYDILNKQSNFSRSINEMRRSDTEYNSIHSYAMLHVIYRLNLFGNRSDRREMGRGRQFGPPEDGERGEGGRGEGRGRGGFGGGRGPGGGGFGGGRQL